jgi:hypothetical protein
MLPPDDARQPLTDLAQVLDRHLAALARLWERSLEQRERALRQEQTRLDLRAEAEKTQRRMLETYEENSRRYAESLRCYAESLRRYEQAQRIGKWVGAGLLAAMALGGLGAWLVFG